AGAVTGGGGVGGGGEPRDGAEPNASQPAADAVDDDDRQRAGDGRQGAPVEQQGGQRLGEHVAIARRGDDQALQRECCSPPYPYQVEIQARVDEPARVQVAAAEGKRVLEDLALIGSGARMREALGDPPEPQCRRPSEEEEHRGTSPSRRQLVTSPASARPPVA